MIHLTCIVACFVGDHIILFGGNAMKKYFSPEYTNEVVMANDVITVSHLSHEVVKDEKGNELYVVDVYNDKVNNVQNATVSAGLGALLGM